MAILKSIPFGVDLAKAFGLDTKNLREFHVHILPDDVVTIDAVYYLADGEYLVEKIKQYNIIAIANDTKGNQIQAGTEERGEGSD